MTARGATKLWLVRAPAAYVEALRLRCEAAGADDWAVLEIVGDRHTSSHVDIVDADSEDGDVQLLVCPDRARKVLDISRSTLDRLTKAGQLPVVRVAGEPRYRTADLEAFVSSLANGSPHE